MTNKNRLKENKKDLQMTRPQVHFKSDEVPTIEQCQQNIRERAHELWEAAGSPKGNDGIEFFLQAEQELYGSPIQGGYRIYVSEGMSNSPMPKILTFNGDLEDERAETFQTQPSQSL